MIDSLQVQRRVTAGKLRTRLRQPICVLGTPALPVAQAAECVDQLEKLQAPKHPELVGLAKGASRAKVLERLIQLGWSTVLQAKRDREQLAAYAAYEADRERTAVARADHEQLARGGVL